MLAEVFRAGVLSLPRGQTEAALAIGLRKGQTMTLILLPQAVTVMLPAIVSQLVVIVKDTALGSQLTIAFPELLASARTITANYGNTVATYTVIALIYIVVDLVLIFLAGRSERWMRTRRGGTKAGPAWRPGDHRRDRRDRDGRSGDRRRVLPGAERAGWPAGSAGCVSC